MAGGENTGALKKISLDSFRIGEQPPPAFLLRKIGHDNRVEFTFKHARGQRTLPRHHVDLNPRGQRQIELGRSCADPVNVLRANSVFIAEYSARPESARIEPARNSNSLAPELLRF